MGALILALAGTLSLAFDLLSWIDAQKLRYQAQDLPGEASRSVRTEGEG